jgi:hypothetical protein
MISNNLTIIHVFIFLVLAIIIISIRPAASLGTKKNHAANEKTNKNIFKPYGPGFFNHSGCLYAHIGGGKFQMTTADGYKINETLELSSLDFETSKSRCTGKTQPGKLTFSFRLDENKRINSLVVSMRILPPDSQGYWEISQTNLTVIRADIDRKRTFPLRLPGIYAGSDYSYSCNALSLTTLPKRKIDNETRADPLAVITLDRFQLQPFPELERVVFAKSYDCSSWITIPGFMGLILILFMLFVTVIGTVLLKNIVTNDFKFNKEGLLFTQSQMETNKNR